MSPMDTAVFWIEYVVRNGMHALRLPIVDMPWWKKNLLDIYGFIFLIIMIALYVVTKTLSFVVRLLRFAKPQNSKKTN